jgi:hypothetical protein
LGGRAAKDGKQVENNLELIYLVGTGLGKAFQTCMQHKCVHKPNSFKKGIWIKVETPIHDNIRELVIWECKEHGVNIVNVLANPKGTVGRWNLNFWRLEQF